MTEQEIQPTGKSNTPALTGLILGILGLLMIVSSCRILPLVNSLLGTGLSIAALVLGLKAKKEIREQGNPSSQIKMANAAFVLGIIGSVFGLIRITIAIIVMLVFTGPTIEQKFQDILDQLQTP